ncbi:NAD-dependent epimerase/dehydratase family protein [Aureispira anguillae]|uniref:NAD(P)-dependent oxidoreductase n=1 Tax=Aureispira anguillae TaxID=2864201 RepID=A0A916DVL0_9BACT|nr:NAD(P)-dependent oxidoreductase [Aureispira anguillae]BDS15249.1 NAD(P)-dependent oxidoreductase [Aureispira anguillae]
MTIAIIGATSFLGKTLISELKERNHQLHLFSRTNSFQFMPTAQWHPYNYPLTPLDTAVLMDFDLIFYCAGAGIQPRHKDNDQTIYELNAFEPIRLITKLKEADYKGKLVTFGSYFEIGNHSEERLYTEKELVAHNNPLPNTYCTAKNLLTRFIDLELRKEQALPYCLQHFILTNIYGATENDNRLIPYIVQSSIKQEALNFTSGEQQRQYTHIRDITQFLFQTLENKESGIFNLTNSQTISVRDMIEKVLHIIQGELDIQPQVTFGTVNKRDVSMKYLGLNTSHLQNCFNFAPKISLEQGIKEYINLYAQIS